MRCLFRWLTGVPCPGCGSLRALRCLARADVAGALAFNPLTTVAALLLLAAAAEWAARSLARRGGVPWQSLWLARLWQGVPKGPAIGAAALLTAANWAWNIAKYM